MMEKSKIFVSAYACEPDLGSEIGVGWHWVLEMSKQFELWVLTRESNRKSIEPWIASHPEFDGIHFVYFDLPKWARFWKKGLRGVRTYYNLWQVCTEHIVKRVMRENQIHIFHHLTYGNALWRVSKYGSSQTFIWGPIGGLETIPKDFSQHYDRKSRLLEGIRRKIVANAIKRRSFKKKAELADLILAKTEDTFNLLPENARKQAVLFTDVATDLSISDGSVRSDDIVYDKPLQCIAVGRLDAWRGFDIAILAISKAIKKNPDIRLTIVGKGIDRERLENMVKEESLNEYVRFTGSVDKKHYNELMNQADVVLNPSLKEGAVTVSFDAMAMGKPLIALDTGGYTRYFNPEYSIVIPRSSRSAVINSFAEAILRLGDKNLRSSMGQMSYHAAKLLTWEHHGREICDKIKESIVKD